MSIEEKSESSYLAAVDFIIWEVLSIFEISVWVTDEKLPDLFAAFINNGPRTKVKFPDN